MIICVDYKNNRIFKMIKRFHTQSHCVNMIHLLFPPQCLQKYQFQQNKTAIVLTLKFNIVALRYSCSSFLALFPCGMYEVSANFISFAKLCRTLSKHTTTYYIFCVYNYTYYLPIHIDFFYICCLINPADICK